VRGSFEQPPPPMFQSSRSDCVKQNGYCWFGAVIELMFDATDFIQYLANTISLELIKRQDRLKETQRVAVFDL
jgi:hypothetical protein